MKPTKQELTEYAAKNSWRKQMDNSQGLDGWDNYGGEDLGDVVVVLSRSRDSECLSESNFDSALEMLGGESDSVRVERFGHWACGWFELILVDPTDLKALLTAYEISKSLKHYPVLDEDDFRERENEMYSDYAEGAKEDLAEALTAHFSLPTDTQTQKAVLAVAYSLNMERQFNNGEDACVDVYLSREPADYELRSLKRDLSNLADYMRDGSDEVLVCEYLLACLGED